MYKLPHPLSRSQRIKSFKRNPANKSLCKLYRFYHNTTRSNQIRRGVK